MHVRVWWATALFRPWVDRASREFKLMTEARAFAAQTKYQDRHGNRMSVDNAAEMLMRPSYGFGLTHAEATLEISKYL